MDTTVEDLFSSSTSLPGSGGGSVTGHEKSCLSLFPVGRVSLVQPGVFPTQKKSSIMTQALHIMRLNHGLNDDVKKKKRFFLSI